jgi:diguanylate cyclase (GGDEF)-like protein
MIDNQMPDLLAGRDDDDPAADARGAAIRPPSSPGQDEHHLPDALRDGLTGLGNRHHFNKTIQDALQAGGGEELALLTIGLDRFKNVNQTLGHLTGDALLRLAARRIRQSTRATETVFRLAGDEFAVLSRNTGDAEALAGRLVEILGRSFLIKGEIATIGASIGIARASPRGGANDLVRHADLALHSAKKAGRQRWHAFEPSMAESAESHYSLEADLRKALKMNEFRLVYQPQQNILTGAVTGLEALLRWHHPTRGVIPPDMFIPVAEEIGAIAAIGEWVLQAACQEAVGWPFNPCIAVNVSPLQFDDPDALFAAVRHALSVSGLAPNRLELEITESTLLRTDQAILETLHRIRALDVRIAMDDFGTGYSSLTQFVAFPFDKIKIDQSFIRGAAARTGGTAVVRAIAALGLSLGMTTIAEGVETREQALLVQSDGCTDIQGYLIGRPIPGHEVPAMLRAFNGSNKAAEVSMP